MKSKVLNLALCALFAGLASIEAQTVRYVKSNGTGDGSSWTNASGSVQDMIDASQTGDEVWVAAGTYFPTCQTDAADVRSKTFLLKNGVHLYGNFAGTETSKEERQKNPNNKRGWSFLNPTFLCGNIDALQDSYSRNKLSSKDWLWNYSGFGGNCYYVVTCPENVVDETVIDGFCINQAAGLVPLKTGAGIYSKGNSIVQNCQVAMNYAAGIENRGSGSVSECLVCNNTSVSGVGGGIYNLTGTVRNCYILRNVAYRQNQITASGGGISNRSGEVIDCIISDNHARVLMTSENTATPTTVVCGGGVYNGTGKITRCYIFNNSAYCYNGSIAGSSHYANTDGGGIYNDGGLVSNCCIYNNQVVAEAKTNNNLNAYARAGGLMNEGEGYVYNSTVINNYSSGASKEFASSNSNINNCITDATDTEINFVNPSNFSGKANTDEQTDALWDADWYLKPGSQYIDAGSTENLPDWIINDTDLDGNPRIYNGKIDLGAYEYQGGNAIAEIAAGELQIIVAGDELRINLLGFQNLTGLNAQIYDVAGRPVKIPFVKKMEYSVANISSLPTGVYIVRIGNQSGKFVK